MLQIGILIQKLKLRNMPQTNQYKCRKFILPEENDRTTKTRLDFEGGASIRFNFNDVRILTGDFHHFVGFLISPEVAMSRNQDCVIAIPPHLCAKFEVALMPRDLLTKKKEAEFFNAGKN